MVPDSRNPEPQEAVTQAAVLAIAFQYTELLALIPRALRDKCVVSYRTVNGWSTE